MLGSGNTGTIAHPLVPANRRDEGMSEDFGGRNGPREQDDTPICVAKRSLPVQSGPTTRRGASGNPGALQDFMKVPIDIFTEIVSYLEPSDLLSLIRTTKFFRKVLLRRSASQIWRRAGQNIQGLPLCPSRMSEPRYAALMFSQHCTLCGGPTKAKPDPYLRVRLCGPCYKTKLISCPNMAVYGGLGLDKTLVLSTPCAGPKKRPTPIEMMMGRSLSLTEDVEVAFCMQQKLLHTRNEEGLLKWVISRRDEIHPTLKDASRMRRYIAPFGQRTGPEREKEWLIHQRLKALGWTDDDLSDDWKGMEEEESFGDEDLLTADGWANSLPKLNSLLHSNRARRAKEAKDRRLQDLLTYFKRTTHPFEKIINAVGIDFSHPLETFPRPFDDSSYNLQYPCPDLNTILEWECFKDMRIGDADISELDQLFEAQLAQIKESFAGWRAELERRLVEKFEISSGNSAINTVLTVNGKTGLTAYLSSNTRFLLRADTVIERTSGRYTGCSAYFYPGVLRLAKLSSLGYLLLHGYHDWDSRWLASERSYDDHEPHTKGQAVARSILKELGMPDATHFELLAMGERFACGRCSLRNRHNWSSIIDHFLDELRRWELQRDDPDIGAMRYSIVHHNTHDLDPGRNPTQLVRISGGEDVPDSPNSIDSKESCQLCGLTLDAWFGCGLDDMMVHMRDVHEIVNPIAGLHYGCEDMDTELWLAKWDAFHNSAQNHDELEGGSHSMGFPS